MVRVMQERATVERLVSLLRRLAEARDPLPSQDGLAPMLGLPCRAKVNVLMANARKRELIVVHHGINGIAAIEAADGSWRAERDLPDRRAVPPRACLRCRAVFKPDHRHNFLCGCPESAA
jgi:hypothetical protein